MATLKVEVERCRLVETWRVKDVPPELAGWPRSLETGEFLDAKLASGEAEFVGQDVSDEEDRTIISVEVVRDAG